MLLSELKWRTLRKKCPYSELFWSAFYRIWAEYGDIQIISPYSVQMRENADQNNSESISPYSVQMRENTDQNNFEHGHFSLSVNWDLKKTGIKLGSIRAVPYFRKLLFSAIIYNAKEGPAFGTRQKGT